MTLLNPMNSLKQTILAILKISLYLKFSVEEFTNLQKPTKSNEFMKSNEFSFSFNFTRSDLLMTIDRDSSTTDDKKI